LRGPRSQERWPGSFVDDEEATKTGDWKRSLGDGAFVGKGYLHDGHENQGKMRVPLHAEVAERDRPLRGAALYYCTKQQSADQRLRRWVKRARTGEKPMKVNQARFAQGGARQVAGDSSTSMARDWVEGAQRRRQRARHRGRRAVSYRGGEALNHNAHSPQSPTPPPRAPCEPTATHSRWQVHRRASSAPGSTSLLSPQLRPRPSVLDLGVLLRPVSSRARPAGLD